MKEKEEISMEVVNTKAAGIDVGSRSHWVCVGRKDTDIQEFGVFNEDLFALADWLEENEIKTVAMESTGTYWQSLYSVLTSKGFEVFLVNGKYTKNIQGKKTDIKDCQWIQQYHALGILPNSFLPDGKTGQLRTYCRHRANLVKTAATTSKKMQKYLRLLNLRLDVVVNDICGLTGMKIIRAICSGETNPQKLASLRHYNCRKSEEEIAKALVTNRRDDYLFALQQELETYDHLQKKIKQCDKKIKEMLDEIIDNDDNKKQHFIGPKPYKRSNKNTPKNFDINLKAYQMFEGNDFLAIEGVSHQTVITLMSEVGIEGIRKFPTAKHFASWLKVSPNNKITGGKIITGKIPKGSNRLKIALRNAANAIGNLKDSTPLRDFFHRINFRKGRTSAITATARKLSIIIWNMVNKNEPYINPEGYLFLDQKRKLGMVKRIQKQIDKYGIKGEEIEFSIS